MGRVICASGARETEDLLLKEVDADQARVLDDPRLLCCPLRIVVPSRSLRNHLSTQIATHRGSALGIVVETHLQAATRIIERTGKSGHNGQDSLMAILVRREAASNRVLQDLLAELAQGYRAVVTSVDDLFHADFSEEILEPLAEAASGLDPPVDAERTLALIEVAVAVSGELQRHQLTTRDMILRLATRTLQDEIEDSSFARAIRIHGFADATGVVTSFLEALLKFPDSALLLDRPPDPTRSGELDPGVHFSRPFGLRLGESNAMPAPTLAPPRMEFFVAPGIRAEAREVACRIRALLDEKTPPAPESIGVVARSLETHLFELEEALDDYGVPWQAPGARGEIDAAGRLLLGLQQILLHRESCSLDAWFSALGADERDARFSAGESGEPTARSSSRDHHAPPSQFSSREADGQTASPFLAPFWKLRVAAAMLGAGRLSRASHLQFERALGRHEDMLLPLQQGLIEERTEEGEAFPRLQRERISRSHLESFRDVTFSLLKDLGEWAETPPDISLSWDDHMEKLRRVVTRHLQWPSHDTGRLASARLEEIFRRFPAPIQLSYDEFFLLLTGEIERAAVTPRPDGGGIRLLSVTDARSLTFDYLFLVGLNRGNFPPSIHEDPLLPDRVRTKLRTILPDLKSKRERGNEERFLFAQLLSSSDRLTLSWWSTDDEGRAVPPSPFVQRLRMNDPTDPPAAAGIFDWTAGQTNAIRPLSEFLLEAALARDMGRFEALLEATLHDEAGDELHARWPEKWAAPARRILEEWDRFPQTAEDLGPWLNGVDPLSKGKPSPWDAPAYVTRLESYAQCPWAEFLQKVLGLDVLPDPLSELPTLDPLRVGNVVHKTLESIVGDASSRTAKLEDLIDRPAREVCWPSPKELETLSEQAARLVLLEEGLVLDGLAKALAVRAQPYLEVCRQSLFEPETLWALGAEIKGGVDLQLPEGKFFRVLFRADLVDRKNGALRLTDYKTGKPFITVIRPDARRRHLLGALRSGTHLQGMIYALAAQALQREGEPAVGRYLHLDPQTKEDLRRTEYESEDSLLKEALLEVLDLLDGARRRGLLFPRVANSTDDSEPQNCQYCKVSAACSRGDSQSRQRETEYFRKLDHRHQDGVTLTPRETMLLKLWKLPEEAKGSRR